MTSPVNNPEEPTVSDPYAALPAARRPIDGAPPFGKPPKEKKKRSYDAAPDPNKPARDKRWFLRIIAWMVLVFGAVIFAFGAMPSDRQITNPGDVISTAQMMILASIPFVAFGLFLVWWGYGKIGEPMIACTQCLHVNKPRTTECKKCGNKFGG